MGARVRRWWPRPTEPRGRTMGAEDCPLGVQSASPMVRPRRAGPVARRVRRACLLGGWPPVGVSRREPARFLGLGTALGDGDVLVNRGLCFPTDRWGLSAVIWGRSKSWEEIAVLDAERLAPGAGVRRGTVVFMGRVRMCRCGCVTVAGIWLSELARIEPWSTRARLRWQRSRSLISGGFVPPDLARFQQPSRSRKHHPQGDGQCRGAAGV